MGSGTLCNTNAVTIGRNYDKYKKSDKYKAKKKNVINNNHNCLNVIPKWDSLYNNHLLYNSLYKQKLFRTMSINQ